MNVYISVDMEGIAGVVAIQHLGGSGDYERFRHLMTQEANAAVQGAIDGGAQTIVVADGHGPMTNILIEELHEAAELISGNNRPITQVTGIEDGFDVLFFVGYHQREGGGDGVLNHTMLGRTIYEVRINGEPADEAAINGAVAGVYNVPVALMTGDDQVCGDAQSRFPGIVTAPVKHALDRYAARSLSAKRAQALIRQRAHEAMEVVKAGNVSPYIVETPVTIEVDFKVTPSANATQYMPGVTRIGPRSISVTADDLVRAIETFQIAARYGMQTSESRG